MCYHMRMSTNNNIDIDKLIEKSLEQRVGGHTPWYKTIPSEVTPFIEGLQAIMRQGKKPNASAISRILTEEFNFPVSRSRIQVWVNEYFSNVNK